MSTIFSCADQLLLDNLLCDPKNMQLKCEQLNQLNQFCFNQKCRQKYNFICQISKCQSCNPRHLQCQRSSIQFILKSFKNKLSITNQIKQSIKQSINQIINQIKLMETKINQDIDKKIRYIYVTKEEKQFIQVLNKKLKPNIFNGQKLNKLRNLYSQKSLSSNNNNNNNSTNNSNNKFLPANINLITTGLQKFITKTIQQTQSTTNKLSLILDSLSNNKLPSYGSLIQLSITNKSSILTQKRISQAKRCIDMFNQLRKVNQYQLIYKATQNQFSIKQYYNKCGSMTNCLILCQTDKGKIIGGYTPLSFNPTTNANGADCYVADLTGESFLFSLTDNTKFILKDVNQAIYRHKSKQYIQFGYGGQLAICDRADINKECFTDFINTSYYNQQYSNTKQGFFKFNGNQTNCFGLKQWEVWKIKYQN